MGKPITIGQSHSVMAILANNVDWALVDRNMLQRVIDDPREAGIQFTGFLKNNGSVIFGDLKAVPIDRSAKFNPVKYIGPGWSIVEEDERSLALSELDLTKVRLESMLVENEKPLRGEVKLERMKAMGHVRLDAKIFQMFWENKHLIPASWKKKVGMYSSRMHVFFDGTILKNYRDERCVLYLSLGDNGLWERGALWLGYQYGIPHSSAVLHG